MLQSHRRSWLVRVLVMEGLNFLRCVAQVGSWVLGLILVVVTFPLDLVLQLAVP
jgi:hypothetical protein